MIVDVPVMVVRASALKNESQSGSMAVGGILHGLWSLCN